MILISQTLFLGTPVAGSKNTRTVLHDVDGKRKVSDRDEERHSWPR